MKEEEGRSEGGGERKDGIGDKGKGERRMGRRERR